jgi:hypothetical protein
MGEVIQEKMKREVRGDLSQTSSSDQSHFLTALSKWLSHLSLHCLPARPGIELAITDLFREKRDMYMMCKRNWPVANNKKNRCVSVHVLTTCITDTHHFLAPILATRSRNNKSSSGSQGPLTTLFFTILHRASHELALL